jgi:lipopolysaccharide export LptBFGC system permease protein LptF
MSPIVHAVNTAAMVLGYLVLALLIGIVLFIASAWLDKWSYQRKKNRRHDIEWDNVRSKWLLEGDIQRARTDEYRVIDSVDRIDTAELGNIPEQVYNYQEELRRDAS